MEIRLYIDGILEGDPSHLDKKQLAYDYFRIERDRNEYRITLRCGVLERTFIVRSIEEVIYHVIVVIRASKLIRKLS
jgi:hypothetical protein